LRVLIVQHKILTASWHMLTHDVACHDLGPDYFDHKPLAPATGVVSRATVVTGPP
jgi:hypothetical protein